MRFLNIAANTAATVAVGNSAKLKRVVINTKGASSNVCTIYDNASAASGTVIATIDTTTEIGNIDYDVLAQNGIVIKLATGTAADITVVWE